MSHRITYLATSPDHTFRTSLSCILSKPTQRATPALQCQLCCGTLDPMTLKHLSWRVLEVRFRASLTPTPLRSHTDPSSSLERGFGSSLLTLSPHCRPAVVRPLSLRQSALASLQAPRPIDWLVRPDTSVVVITGPNTGGKTAAMKALGLAACMAKAGLPMPAEAPARLPAFSAVLADIGDEQSLTANLSTFSGHLKRIQVW